MFLKGFFLSKQTFGFSVLKIQFLNTDKLNLFRFYLVATRSYVIINSFLFTVGNQLW